MENPSLKKWLDSAAPKGGIRRSSRPTRCETCLRYKHLHADIGEFLRMKAEGEIHLPTYSHSGAKSLLSYLASKGYDLGGMSLTRHIGLCLGLDPKTGKPQEA